MRQRSYGGIQNRSGFVAVLRICKSDSQLAWKWVGELGYRWILKLFSIWFIMAHIFSPLSSGDFSKYLSLYKSVDNLGWLGVCSWKAFLFLHFCHLFPHFAWNNCFIITVNLQHVIFLAKTKQAIFNSFQNQKSQRFLPEGMSDSTDSAENSDTLPTLIRVILQSPKREASHWLGMRQITNSLSDSAS